MAWVVAGSLNTLQAQLNTGAPRRSKASDGSIGDLDHRNRASDHNPWYKGSIVTARDFTHDPAGGLDCHELAEDLVASRDPRIKYIIWHRRIADSRPVTRTVGGVTGTHPPWTWLPYTGPNPHTAHLHLSVLPNPVSNDTRLWQLPMFSGGRDVDMTPEEHRWLEATHRELTMRLPNRVDFGYLGDPEPVPRGTDTVLGMSCNSDARAYEAREMAARAERGVREMKALLTVITEQLSSLQAAQRT